MSAAFGAAATAAWTLVAGELELREAAKKVVDAEIRSFWARVEYLKFPAKLTNAINKNEEVAEKYKKPGLSNQDREIIEKMTYPLVRRSIGQDWFVFFRTHPLELARLAEIQSDFVSLSIVARNLVSRFDYINQADASKQSFIFWHEEHKRVLNSLHEIHVSSNAILSKLKLKIIEPIQ
ncbi:hypothetical protein GCM10007863_45440 [Dyella mobilis]|nr:hypothetical protein GCM10007863_45440 [Dyella mobilis]